MKTRFLIALLALTSIRPAQALASCLTPANPIEAENCLPGNPPIQWDTSSNESDTIAGFATDISVNPGSTIHFKIKTTAASYTITIYRIGYYAGNGARLMASVSPSVSLPQTQPACLNVAATGLNDCGNWAESASWVVPSTATSGLYVADLKRTDTGAVNFIPFVVRNDPSHSAITFKTSDTTWHAYNNYGGNSLYVGSPVGRAYKVSYNRPIDAADVHYYIYSWEVPAIRFLESNGYDVSYMTSVDADRAGGLITNHKTFLSVGHDEYWSANERNNVEAARNLGVNLAFWSGNESFWKTRWENSIDGSSTTYRTLVCYKESYGSSPSDPQDPPTWTGEWRDGRFSPPADGGRPENSMSGTMYITEERDDTMQVPAAYGKLRIWRNSSVASLSSGTVASFPELLGYEYDTDEDNGFRPAGLIDVSTTTTFVSSSVLVDVEGTYTSGWVTHNLTLYRHPSGAIVFGAGSIQWPWGLDSYHDNFKSGPYVPIQQAMVNLFADMGIQPATLQGALVAASASTDAIAPTSVITSPATSGNAVPGSTITIMGTAVDTGGGVVAGVEVSMDGGITWHPAQGTNQWTYVWVPTAPGAYILKSRATDDSLNIEGVTISTVPVITTYSLFPSTFPPPGDTYKDPLSIEVGVKFHFDVDGYLMALRFYKQPSNNGGHVGHLWTSTGVLLASAPFTNETASGWQTAYLPNPIPIQAGATYVSSYFSTTGYGITPQYFTTGVDNFLLHAPASSVDPNGVYVYGSSSAFPNQSTNSTNYWTDVIVSTTGGSPNPAPALTSILPVSTTQFAPGLTLQAKGSNFVLGSVVQWNGSAVPTTFVDSATLSALIPASDFVSTATVPITVFTLAPGGDTSSTQTFIVNQATYTLSPVPVLTSMNPVSAAQGSTFVLTLNGNNFVSSSTVFWNGIASSTTYVSTFTLTALIPNSDLTAIGVATVTVVTPPAGGGTSLNQYFSVYPASGPTCPCELFVAGAVPGPKDAYADPNPLEIGVRFRADVNGSITGLRFYKGAFNAGAHTGHLWTDSGTLLATTSFAGESASGWQTVLLSTPVPVQAGTMYVASYFTASGYSITDNYFISGVDNFPLHSPASSIESNGVYVYSSSSTFPNQTALSRNYWVDVVYLNAPPTVTALLPSSTTVGGTAMPLTVTGTNFISSSTVQWNSSTRSTTFVSSSTLIALIPPSDLISVGMDTVTVSNPGLGGATSSGTIFIVNNPVPVLTTLSPNSILIGSSSFTLTLTGSNFVSSSTVQWNGSVRTTTFVSSSTLTALIPASDLTSLAITSITVFNPALGGGTSSSQTFIVGNPVPILIALSSSSTTIGSSSFTLTLTGSNFVSSSTVQWDGSARTTTYVSGSTLTAVIPASDLTSVEIASVTVFNPALGGGTSSAQTFIVGNPLPTLTSISQSSATAGGAGFTLIVTGSNFIPNSAVQWNRSARTTTYVSSSTLTTLVPASDLTFVGVSTITVFNTAPGGGTSNAKSFTVSSPSGGGASVNPVPALTGLSPGSVPAGVPGFTLTLLGSGFTNTSTVIWNGTALTSTFVSNNTLTAAIPAIDVAVPGSATVSIFTAGPGGGTSGNQTFTVGGIHPRVFPNPWRVDQHANQPIMFDGLSYGSTVKIFTASAHWVKTLDAPNGSAPWDLTTDSGKPVASGYYIYLITDGSNNKTRGILGIIR